MKNLRSNQISSDSVLNKGLEYHRNRKNKEALECYRKIKPGDPNYADALHLMGLISKDDNNIEVAIALINQAIELNKKAVFFSNRAGIYAGIREYQKSLMDYEESLKIEPRNPMTLYNYGAVLKQTGETSKALTYFYKCLDLDPDYIAAKQMVAIIKMQADPNNPESMTDLIEAVSLLQDIIKANPNDFESWKTLAHLAYTIAPRCVESQKQQMFLYSCGAYEKCMELSPRNLQVINNLAAAYKDAGLRQACVDTCRQALSIQNNYKPALHNLANTLHEQGFIKPALHYSNQIIKDFKGANNEYAMLVSSYLFTYLCYEPDFKKVAERFNFWGDQLCEKLK